MPPRKPTYELESAARAERIDLTLDAAGWVLPSPQLRPLHGPYRTVEETTDNGPADYALWLNRQVVGVIEAKKVTLGPQNVLWQAEMYARGLRNPKFNFDGLGCPFIYSTNGSVTWFHDVRRPLNRARQVAGFHTPNAFREMFSCDFDAACDKVLHLPHDHPHLRPYQKEANARVEKAIAARNRSLLVAMATGPEKTLTIVNQIYRLMKAGVGKRILFLVDRRALVVQAVRAFSAFDAESGQKFNQIYEVYSSPFQTEDFGDEEKFDAKVMPQSYLTDPQSGYTFVFVATIQRIAMNVLGRKAIFGFGEELIENGADRLDIPIHAFDVIISDECHRGYTSHEITTWRQTLDHFDGIKIGFTATPAAHTNAYFKHKVFEFGVCPEVCGDRR